MSTSALPKAGVQAKRFLIILRWVFMYLNPVDNVNDKLGILENEARTYKLRINVILVYFSARFIYQLALV